MRANPQAIAGRLTAAVVYGREHPLGRFATEASYGSIGIDDCRAFASTWLRPQGARLFAVGDLTRAEILAKVEPRLAALAGKPGRVPEPGKPQAPKGRVFFVDVPGAAQSVVTLTHLGPPRTAPDYFATHIMSGIVSGGFTSRINMNIREKHGYAYGAGGGFAYSRKQGTYRVSSSVRTDVTRESIVEILKELNGFRDGEATDEELGREKASRVLALPARFATGNEVLGAFRELVYHGLPLTYYDGYVKGYETVTKASVRAAARKHLRPADLRLLVVGDGKAVLPKLRELAAGKDFPGEVVLLDADGVVAK
jgi:zinc protease